MSDKNDQTKIESVKGGNNVPTSGPLYVEPPKEILSETSTPESSENKNKSDG